jgi:hypothetical protein
MVKKLFYRVQVVDGKVDGFRYLGRIGPLFLQGKFGFMLPGSDSIAISNFSFTPK